MARLGVGGALFVLCCLASTREAIAQIPGGIEYRVLATNKTSTMQKELQEAYAGPDEALARWKQLQAQA